VGDIGRTGVTRSMRVTWEAWKCGFDV